MPLILRLYTLVLLSNGSLCIGQVTDSVTYDTTVKEKRYYLVLDKPGKITRLRFYVGSRLNFSLTGENQTYTAVITGIQKETLEMLQTQIRLTEIDRITVPQQANVGRFLNGLGNGLRGAGSLFFLVGASNYLL